MINITKQNEDGKNWSKYLKKKHLSERYSQIEKSCHSVAFLHCQMLKNKKLFTLETLYQKIHAELHKHITIAYEKSMF